MRKPAFLLILLILVMPLMGMSCSFLTDDQLQLYSAAETELALKSEALDPSGALARYDAATAGLDAVLDAAEANPSMLSVQELLVLETMYKKARDARLAVFAAVRAQPPDLAKAKAAGQLLFAMTVVLEAELTQLAAKMQGG